VGQWSATCGNCINTNGVFFTDISQAGEFEVTFTTFGACPGTGTLLVGVSEELEGQISVPPIICEDDEVTFTSDVPGTWSATCGDCIDSATGTFAPAGTEEDTYDVTFIPESFCPIESYATVTVSPSVSIGGGNVPVSMCVEAAEVDFNTNVSGGVWTASCGDCITADGLFDPAAAGPGVVNLNYAVESGACSDSADYAVDINPVLSGSLEDLAPLCVGSTASLDFVYDPDIPEEYTTSCPAAAPAVSTTNEMYASSKPAKPNERACCANRDRSASSKSASKGMPASNKDCWRIPSSGRPVESAVQITSPTRTNSPAATKHCKPILRPHSVSGSQVACADKYPRRWACATRLRSTRDAQSGS
jgi:hypothetical protein